MPKLPQNRLHPSRTLYRLLRSSTKHKIWIAGILIIAAIAIVLLTAVDLGEIVGTVGGVPTITPSAPQNQTSPSHESLMLIENKGQFDESVRFQVRGDDRTIWMTENALWVTLNPLADPTATEGVNLKLSFVSANPNPLIEPFDPLDVCVSYFFGNAPGNWHADVPAWGGVKYTDLYSGVDMEFAREEGRWTWRLLVRDPGFDLSSIRLHVEGAETIDLVSPTPAAGESGTGGEQRILISTPAGDFTLPLLQIERADVPSARVELDEVINPFISADTPTDGEQSGDATPNDTSDLFYATFLGGNSSDSIEDIDLDQDDNVYLVGRARSEDFPTTPGSFDITQNGLYDTVVAKLDSTGSDMIYLTFLGGGKDDQGRGVVADKSGNAYVVGETGSHDFPTTPGALDTTCGTDGACNADHQGISETDAYLVKLNPSSTLLEYATFIGGSKSDRAAKIALDDTNHIHIVGDTSSPNFLTTNDAFDTTHNGSSDTFLIKLNAADFTIQYAAFVGGNREESGEDIALDGSGNTYVTGTTLSTDFPTSSNAFSECAPPDAFVIKVDSTGSSLGYATCLGGSGADYGRAIAVEERGNAYVMGNTLSSDFPVTPGAFDTSYDYDDVFIAKLASDGSALEYATYLGGSSTEYGPGDIVVNEIGNAYVTGGTETYDPEFPTTPDAFDTTHNGSYDAFVVELDIAGSALEYATFLGGSGRDHGYAIALGQAGSVYVAGATSSPNFPITANAFDTTYNSSSAPGDAFVVELQTPAYHFISGQVIDGQSYPIAEVTISNTDGLTATTDSEGYYVLGKLDAGTYTLTLSKSGYIYPAGARTVSIPPDATDQDFVLQPGPISIDVIPNLPSELVYAASAQTGIRIEFPANTMSFTTTLTLTPTITTQQLPKFAFAGVAFDLVASQEGQPLDDLTFNKPITISIQYSDIDVQIINKEQLTLQRRTGGSWEDAIQSCLSPTSYNHNPDENQLSVTVCQPGQFGLFGPTNQIYVPIILKDK